MSARTPAAFAAATIWLSVVRSTLRFRTRQLINHVSIHQSGPSGLQMTTLIMPLSPKRSTSRICNVSPTGDCSKDLTSTSE